MVQIRPRDTRDSGTNRHDVAVGSGSTQPASDRCGGHADLFCDLTMSEPFGGSGQGRPDGLDTVGASRERPDGHEHVGAVALTASCASWSHRVGATTEKPNRSGPSGAPRPKQPRAVRGWAGMDTLFYAGGGDLGIEHEQQRRAFLECDRRDGRPAERVRAAA